MKGYKGFDKDFKCNNFQYEEGKTYEEDEAIICKKGFHFCKNPMDVLDYYSLIDDCGNVNQFAEVESLGDKSCLCDDENFDSKFCTKKIKIGSKLSLEDFIKTSYKYIKKTQGANYKKSKKRKQNWSEIAKKGYESKIALKGIKNHIITLGTFSEVKIEGYENKVLTNGSYSQVNIEGIYNQILINGWRSQAIVRGDANKILTNESNVQVTVDGNSNTVAAKGKYNRVVMNGNLNTLVLDGQESIGVNIGIDGKIKGKKGCWITLAEYVKCDIKHIKSARIDGKTLKEDTFYQLVNGKFVEVKVENIPF